MVDPKLITDLTKAAADVSKAAASDISKIVATTTTTVALDLESIVSARVLNTLKDQLGDTWVKLKPEIASALESCSRQVGVLAVRALKGEDVSDLQLDLDSQVANLVAIGADIMVKNFWLAVHKVIGTIGEILGDLLKGALKGIVGL